MNEDLVHAAMRLRSENRPAWEQFVMAMRAYSAECAMAVVKSTPDDLVRKQGGAQLATHLTESFMTIDRIFDDLRTKKAAKANHNGRQPIP